jgi:hypothetical protein
MADSDNNTTLSNVTRSNAIAGRAPVAVSPNNSKAISETLRPTFRVRGGQDMKKADRLGRRQQRGEAD